MIKCKDCGEDCTRRHLMCDENLDQDAVWCPVCFDKTPCGLGQHDEGCATLVIEDEE